MRPDLGFIPCASRPHLHTTLVPRSPIAAAASPASSSGRRPGPLRGPDNAGQDPDTFTHHGHVHRLVRFQPGQYPAEPVPRQPATAELPTTTGFLSADVEITARTPHLVHVLHTDETGKTLGTWLPPRLVHPRGAGRRLPRTDTGGGEDGNHE